MKFCLLLKTWAISIVQNFLIVLKKSTADAIKTASKRAIQKAPEATGDLIRYKITNNITSISQMSPKELHSQNEDKIEIPKEKYISPE